MAELTKDPSLNLNKPSEEEIVAAQKEFEEAAKTFTIKTYPIGKPEEAEEFYNYLIHFINNRYLWQKEAWMGTIKLVEELESSAGLFRSEKDKSLLVGYQALEFVFFALSNPGGLGLQAAKDFEEENDIFIRVATAAGDQLEQARSSLKEIEFLQQKWGAMAQGFYLEIEPKPDEDLPEGAEEFIEDPVEESTE